MRRLAATAATLVLLALATGSADAAQEDATPGLLTTEQLNARMPGSGLLILRGSAIAPKGAAATYSNNGRWQVVAGRRLWLVDPQTKELRTCHWQQTSTVDVEVISCQSGTFGRYTRGFGPAFQP